MKSKAPPPMPFWADDWLSSPTVMLLTPAEEGALIRLCAICWLNKDKALPGDSEELRRLSRLDKRTWSRGNVQRTLMPHPDLPGNFTHPKVLACAQDLADYRANQAESGKAGAEKRWGRHSEAMANGWPPSPLHGASPASPSGEPSVRVKDSASLPHSSEQNVCKTTTARDPSSTAPTTARAPRKRRPTLTEEAQRERVMIRELFAAYTRAMVRVHGPLAATAPAESEPHLKAAREVLESCGWDVAAACALVDLYPEMREDKWVVGRKWAFRWVASRISDLAAERAKRTEDPAVANERWRQQEIAEMKRMGIDVSDD